MARRSFLSSFLEGNVNGMAGVVPRSVPSAILVSGMTIVPLWAVSSMAIASSYRSSSSADGTRQFAGPRDDTLTLSAALIGWDRFVWKQQLEFIRNAAVSGWTPEQVSDGLILVTSMTIRTDMYIQSLSFTASATRRDVIEVSMTLVHLPRQGLIDGAGSLVSTLAEFAVS